MSRYKHQVTPRHIEAALPFWVDIAIPPNGLGRGIDDMTNWHLRRDRVPNMGTGGTNVARFCFDDAGVADEFATEFGGQRITTVISLECLNCHHKSTMREDELEQYGEPPGTPLAKLTRRFRCGQCASGAVKAVRIEEIVPHLRNPWLKKLARPYKPPIGKKIVTLADARDYIVRLPEEEQLQPGWQDALRLLITAASGYDADVVEASMKFQRALLLAYQRTRK